MKYRKKPIVIEAIQWTGDNLQEIIDFIGLQNFTVDYLLCLKDNTAKPERLIIDTLEGSMLANIGDYIVKGIKGEYYPCKEDIFKEIYEPLDNN